MKRWPWVALLFAVLVVNELVQIRESARGIQQEMQMECPGYPAFEPWPFRDPPPELREQPERKGVAL